MQEDLQPIELPPGIWRNGTKYQAKGRWYDAHLVRFQGPRIQPIGGWAAAPSAAGGDLQALTGMARACLAWSADDGSVKVAIGTHQKLYLMINGTFYDITPTVLASVDLDSGYAGGIGGYGSGAFGVGAYGVGSIIATLDDADTWQLDTFGDYLVGCLTEDGRIYVWQGVTATPAAQATGSPVNCSGVVCTPERYVFALGAGGNKRKVQWPPQEGFTVWTPSATETAGDFELATNGRIRCGARTKSETLIWTDVDLHVATWIGGTLIYSFRQAGDGCGIIGPNAKATIDTKAYWMGRGSFYMYNGVVQPIPCDVQDYVFSDFNETQAAKIWAQRFSEFNEIWWFYPSGGATEVDRYVAYNYVERHWSRGTLARVAGCDQGAPPNPLMIKPTYSAQGTLTSTGTIPANNDTVTINGKVYTFQTALTNVNGNVLIGANTTASLLNLKNAINLGAGSGTTYAALTTLHPTVQAEVSSSLTLLVRSKISGTTGNAYTTTETSAQLAWGGATLAGGASQANGYPTSDIYEHEVGFGRGSEVPYVESGPYNLDGGNGDFFMRIQQLVPDELVLGQIRTYFYTGVYPTGTETLNGPYTSANPTSVRLSAKQARIRYEEAVQSAWRVGVMRAGLKQEGRR